MNHCGRNRLEKFRNPVLRNARQNRSAIKELSDFLIEPWLWFPIKRIRRVFFWKTLMRAVQWWLDTVRKAWWGYRSIRAQLQWTFVLCGSRRAKTNSTTRAGNNKDGSFSDSCGLIILCLHLNIRCNILTAGFMHWSIERVHVETSIPGLSGISLFSNLYVQTSYHE